MQRIMSFWLGALVASLVLMAIVPGVLSWSPEDEEGGSDGGSRGLDPLNPQDGETQVPKEHEEPGEDEWEAGGEHSGQMPRDESDGDEGGHEGTSGGVGRGLPDGGSDGFDEESEHEDEKEKEGDSQQGEEAPGRGGPVGFEGEDDGDDGSHGEESRTEATDVVTDRKLPCLQLSAHSRCGEGQGRSVDLRSLRDLLSAGQDEGDDEDAGDPGQQGAPAKPLSHSRVVTPAKGPDLLVWGAGLGLFAVVLGVLVRLFTVYCLGRGFLPAGWRLDRERVVNHPVRRDILDHLKKQPGATIQELAEVAGVANSRAAYHVSVLKREECVSERVVDGRRHIFLHAAPVVEPERLRKRALGRAGRSPARVLAFLRQSPGATVSHVARALGFSPGHAHYHLTRLAKEGMLDRVRRGRRVRHYLTSEGQELVAQPEEPAAGSAVFSRQSDEVAA